MDYKSHVATEAFALLLDHLIQQLDDVDCLANKWDKWSELEVAAIREIVGSQTGDIRQLLKSHKPGFDNMCCTCGAQSPCDVLTMIHEMVARQEAQLAHLGSASNDDAQ